LLRSLFAEIFWGYSELGLECMAEVKTIGKTTSESDGVQFFLGSNQEARR
jgi:hypothetical protein